MKKLQIDDSLQVDDGSKLKIHIIREEMQVERHSRSTCNHLGKIRKSRREKPASKIA